MLLRVRGISEIAPEIWQITIGGEFPYETIQPGQFLMIRVGSGKEHVLRRPISIAAVTKESMTIIQRVVGQGPKCLSARCIDESLNVMIP